MLKINCESIFQENTGLSCYNKFCKDVKSKENNSNKPHTNSTPPPPNVIIEARLSNKRRNGLTHARVNFVNHTRSFPRERCRAGSKLLLLLLEVGVTRKDPKTITQIEMCLISMAKYEYAKNYISRPVHEMVSNIWRKFYIAMDWRPQNKNQEIRWNVLGKNPRKLF